MTTSNDVEDKTITIKAFPILKQFNYSHLKSIELKEVSQKFHTLAWEIAQSLPVNEERHVCLRKLLEAKDCAVRSVLD